MKIENISTEGLKSVFNVSFSQDFIESEKKTLLEQHAKNYKKPGFRPGKVPFALIEKEFGAAATNQVIDEQLTAANDKIIQENNLKIAKKPEVQNISSEDENTDIQFKLSYESMPSIELQDISAIELEKITYDIPDDDVITGLHKVINQHAPYKDVDKEVEERHIVTIEVTMTRNGQPVKDIQNRSFYISPGNPNTLYPAVARDLYGKKLNDHGRVEEKLDDGFPLTHVRGQQVVIDYVVKRIEEKEEINSDDDAFFEKIGYTSSEQAKDVVKKKLESEMNQDARLYMKRKLFDLMNESYSFDLPPSIVEAEEKSIRTQMKESEDENVSDEEIKKIAERRVRLGLVIGEIANKKDIKPTDEEVAKRMMPYLYNMGMEPQKAYEKLIKNKRFMDIMRSEALEECVVDYIIAHAKVTDKKISKEEFEAEILEIMPE